MGEMVRLPDKPLIKEAGFFSELGLKLGRGAIKALEEAGPKITKVMGRWWAKATPDVAKIMEIKALKEIPNEVYHAGLFEDAMSQKIKTAMSSANKEISEHLLRLRREVQASKAEVDIWTRTISKTSKEPDEHLRKLQKIYKQNEDQLNLFKSLATDIKTDPQSVVVRVKDTPHMGSEYPALGRWVEIAEQYMPIKNQILAATSKNLNNDKAFVKEYLKYIQPLEKENPVRLSWLANPQNKRTLTKLKMSGKLGDIIRAGESAISEGKRPDLSGLGVSKLMKTLGIGAAAAGTVGAAISLFSWADKEAPKIEEKASSIAPQMPSIRVSGAGAIVLKDTEASVSKIDAAQEKLKAGLTTNPGDAFAEYFRVVSTEKEKIDRNLRQWGSVVANAEDPEKARQMGENLRELSKEIEQRLQSAGKSVGLTPEAAKPVTSNISDLQAYLATINANVKVTGVLDQNTIKTLQYLEGRYNILADTDRFTGLFYNPNTKQTISVSDLKKLENI